MELLAATEGLLVFSSPSTSISLFSEARYRVSALVQVAGSVAYRYRSADPVSDVALQFFAGPVFNFPLAWETQNAFFVSPRVGLTTGQTVYNDVQVGSDTQLTFAFYGGKRFKIVDAVAYTPTVGAVKEWSHSPSLVIQPVSFSFFL